MRVPTRKPGDRRNTKFDPHITAEKHQELQSRLSRLYAARPRLAEEVKRLAHDGDFSENAAYQIAKGRLRGLNNRIDEIEFRLKNADIIIKHPDSSMVRLGSTVRVEKDGRSKTWTILGSTETDPLAGIISHNSPIGAALLGKRTGETLKLTLNGRTSIIKIIEIS